MPSGLLDEFWKDPAFAAEIHLTDAQRKQLDEAALLHRLALVDGGAESFKAVIKLSAILDAEPFDDAAYQKQLDELTASSGKLIQTFGAMVSTPRRVLNSEQWAKLEKRKRERARQATPKSAVMQPGAQPQIPSSLLQPLQQ
jgi:Spy/CpxP family protein refolding chaperone